MRTKDSSKYYIVERNKKFWVERSLLGIKFLPYRVIDPVQKKNFEFDTLKEASDYVKNTLTKRYYVVDVSPNSSKTRKKPISIK